MGEWVALCLQMMRVLICIVTVHRQNGYYIDFGSQAHEFVVTSVLEIDVHL